MRFYEMTPNLVSTFDTEFAADLEIDRFLTQTG
jgi:hypothetical protein